MNFLISSNWPLTPICSIESNSTTNWKPCGPFSRGCTSVTSASLPPIFTEMMSDLVIGAISVKVSPDLAFAGMARIRISVGVCANAGASVVKMKSAPAAAATKRAGPSDRDLLRVDKPLAELRFIAGPPGALGMRKWSLETISSVASSGTTITTAPSRGQTACPAATCLHDVGGALFLGAPGLAPAQHRAPPRARAFAGVVDLLPEADKVIHCRDDRHDGHPIDRPHRDHRS